MDIQAIDWNEVWKKKRTRVYDDGQNQTYWDGRAPSFALATDGGPYVAKFLEVLKPEPDWRILDVGCAAGTLAVPLASRVCQVTALDISPIMLDCLQSTCLKRGIQNIRPVQASWTDDWDLLPIEPHDVAIASRSLIVPDLRESLEKLDRFATRRVCITTPVGSGSMDPAMFKAIGRRSPFDADYIYVYNLLYQMGAQAHVSFISYQEDRSYQDLDEAFRALQSKVWNLLPQEEKALRDYIRRSFVCRADRFYRRDPLTICWAAMWWTPLHQRKSLDFL